MLHPRIRRAPLALSATLALGAMACTTTGDPWFVPLDTRDAAAGDVPPAASSAWQDEVRPILEAKGCLNNGCHDATSAASGLNATTPDGLLAGGDHGAAVVPCDSAGSLLVQLLEGLSQGVARMPITQDWLSEDEIATVAAWVDAGAAAVDDPTICGEAPGPAEGISYADDVLPIFEAKCVGCHLGGVMLGGLDVSTAELAAEGGDSGPGIAPCEPDDSTLYQRLLPDPPGGAARMPQTGDWLTEGELETVRTWIAQGGEPAYDPATCASE